VTSSDGGGGDNGDLVREAASLSSAMAEGAPRADPTAAVGGAGVDPLAGAAAEAILVGEDDPLAESWDDSSPVRVLTVAANELLPCSQAELEESGMPPLAPATVAAA